MARAAIFFRQVQPAEMTHQMQRICVRRLFAVVLALSAVSFSFVKPASAQIFAKYCSPEVGVAVLLVDATTQIDDQDKRVLERGVAGMLRRLAPGQRLTIRQIADHGAKSDEMFSGCRPGCLRGPAVGMFICSPATERIDLDNFSGLVRQVIEKFKVRNVSHPNSAISGTILRALTENFSVDSVIARQSSLFVFSDLIENFGPVPRDQMLGIAKAALREDDIVARLLSNNPSGVKIVAPVQVTVFGVGRDDLNPRLSLAPIQEVRVRQIWGKFFVALGAVSVQIAQDFPQ